MEEIARHLPNNAEEIFILMLSVLINSALIVLLISITVVAVIQAKDLIVMVAKAIAEKHEKLKNSKNGNSK